MPSFPPPSYVKPARRSWCLLDEASLLKTKSVSDQSSCARAQWIHAIYWGMITLVLGWYWIYGSSRFWYCSIGSYSATVPVPVPRFQFLLLNTRVSVQGFQEIILHLSHFGTSSVPFRCQFRWNLKHWYWHLNCMEPKLLKRFGSCGIIGSGPTLETQVNRKWINSTSLGFKTKYPYISDSKLDTLLQHLIYESTCNQW